MTSGVKSQQPRARTPDGGGPWDGTGRAGHAAGAQSAPSLQPPCKDEPPLARAAGLHRAVSPAPRAQGKGGGRGSWATGAPGRGAGQSGMRASWPQGARRSRSGRRGFPDREPAGLSSSVSPPNSCPHRRPCLQVILPKATHSGSRVGTTQTDSVPQGLRRMLPRTGPTAATTCPAVGHWRFFRRHGPHDSRYFINSCHRKGENNAFTCTRLLLADAGEFKK